MKTPDAPAVLVHCVQATITKSIKSSQSDSNETRPYEIIWPLCISMISKGVHGRAYRSWWVHLSCLIQCSQSILSHYIMQSNPLQSQSIRFTLCLWLIIVPSSFTSPVHHRWRLPSHPCPPRQIKIQWPLLVQLAVPDPEPCKGSAHACIENP